MASRTPSEHVMLVSNVRISVMTTMGGSGVDDDDDDEDENVANRVTILRLCWDATN